MNKNKFYLLNKIINNDDDDNDNDNDYNECDIDSDTYIEDIKEKINYDIQINEEKAINQNKKFPDLNKTKIYKSVKIIKNDNKKKFNHKKILCINFITNNNCNHGSKCSYAHSLNEQNIDAYRQKTIDILNSNDDLSYIDFKLYQYKILMKDLLTYTKLCESCINKKCTGGYNCKYGSCLEKYVICYDDLNYNYCINENCNKIHLSKRKLKPILNKIYYTIDNHIKNNINEFSNKEYINYDIFNNINDNNQKNKYDILEDNNNYILETLNNIILNNVYINDDMKDNFFDESSDEECEKSIFIDKIDKIIFDND